MPSIREKFGGSRALWIADPRQQGIVDCGFKTISNVLTFSYVMHDTEKCNRCTNLTNDHVPRGLPSFSTVLLSPALHRSSGGGSEYSSLYSEEEEEEEEEEALEESGSERSKKSGSEFSSSEDSFDPYASDEEAQGKKSQTARGSLYAKEEIPEAAFMRYGEVESSSSAAAGDEEREGYHRMPPKTATGGAKAGGAKAKHHPKHHPGKAKAGGKAQAGPAGRLSTYTS